jgi:hypothetical protein
MTIAANQGIRQATTLEKVSEFKAKLHGAPTTQNDMELKYGARRKASLKPQTTKTRHKFMSSSPCRKKNRHVRTDKASLDPASTL